MKAAIHARVSKRDKWKETENQLVQLREFASRSGWKITREYVDHESGKSGDRDQFKALFEDAGCRKFNVLLFWSRDRLTREGALESLQYLNRLSSYGVGFHSLIDSYLDSCGMFKDAVIAILGTIAKQERVRLSERTRAGLRLAVSKGKTLGRPHAEFDTAQARATRATVASYRAIAMEFGVSVATAHDALRSENVPASVAACA